MTVHVFRPEPRRKESDKCFLPLMFKVGLMVVTHDSFT